MTCLHITNLLNTLTETANILESREPQAIDPHPHIAHLREAAHIIRHIPLAALAKLPPFPTTPTFP